MSSVSVGSAPWSEPGGEGDPDNPQLPVPSTATVLDEGNAAYWRERGGGGDVSDAEIAWMVAQRELVLSEAQLTKDYGEEAAEMLRAIDKNGIPKSVAGALAWPGVGTRWRRFISWWSHLSEPNRPQDAHSALAHFARAIGRVRTYRALALNSAGLERIFAEDEIAPSGRLRPGVDAEQIRRIVEEHGVMKLAVVRLYIAHIKKIGGIDPTISLHDDWQTTSIIASGYASEGKQVHLFELCVPAVESLGWTLDEVAARSGPILGDKYVHNDPWFRFRAPASPSGTWFDGTLQRTERYGLYGVPHLRNRLRHLYVFDSIAKVTNAVCPFNVEVERKHEEFEQKKKKKLCC